MELRSYYVLWKNIPDTESKDKNYKKDLGCIQNLQNRVIFTILIKYYFSLFVII